VGHDHVLLTAQDWFKGQLFAKHLASRGIIAKFSSRLYILDHLLTFQPGGQITEPYIIIAGETRNGAAEWPKKGVGVLTLSVSERLVTGTATTLKHRTAQSVE